jgi:hypothetical protein
MVRSSRPSWSEAPGHILKPRPYHAPLPTAIIMASRVSGASSTSSVYESGRKAASSAKTAMLYRSWPGRRWRRSERMFTRASKPTARIVPTHVTAPSTVVTRSASTGCTVPSAMAWMAADGSVSGMPTARAMSLPAPAGRMPSAVPVPATACNAMCTNPSPPTATSTSAPSATACLASIRDSSALPPATVRTSSPAAASAVASSPASRGARPGPAAGLTSSATSRDIVSLRLSVRTPGRYRKPNRSPRRRWPWRRKARDTACVRRDRPGAG